MFTVSRITLLVLIISSVAATLSHGQSTSWNAGGANDNFTNPANWTNGVPGPTSLAGFNLNNSTYDVVLDQDSFVATCTFQNGVSNLKGPGKLTIGGIGFSSNHLATFSNQVCVEAQVLRVGQTMESEWVITGAGTEIRSDDFQVGVFGSGQVEVKQGATLITNNRGFVGAVDSGVMSIEGVGSRWIAGNSLQIGTSDTGVVNVLAGGHLIGNEIEVAFTTLSPDGVGTVIVSGSQSRLECNDCFIGGGPSGGQGSLRVSSFGQASVSDLMAINPASCLTVSGSAKLSVGQILNRGLIELQTGIICGDVANVDNGRIEVAALSVASIQGDLRNDGAEVFVSSTGQLIVFGDWTGSRDFGGTGIVDFEAGVRPGGGLGGTPSVNFAGDVTFQSDAAVEIEFAGMLPSQFDQLFIEGDLEIDGSLSVEAIGGFEFSSEQELAIIQVGGNLTGTFDGLPEGAVVGTTGNAELIISYIGGNGNDVTIRPRLIKDPCVADIGIINGELVISGTQGPEDIIVTESGGMLLVDYNQECFDEFPVQNVSRVVINGFGGVDVIVADVSVPTLISGGFGADVIMGGQVENEIFGGPGADTICGGPNDDLINAGRGQDTVFALGGDDVVIGGDANDMLVGGPGNDELFGGLGADSLYGNGGEDTLIGNVGADLLDGGANNDSLSGLGGPDELLGGGGDDELRGGEGFDVLNGNSGTDTALDNGEVEISIEIS